MIVDNEFKVYILSIMITLTILSNLCNLIAILNRKRKKICRMYFFLLNLLFADVLTAFLTLLPELMETIAKTGFDQYNSYCKAVKCLQMFAPYLRLVQFLPCLVLFNGKTFVVITKLQCSLQLCHFKIIDEFEIILFE